MTGREVTEVPFADYLKALPHRCGITAPELRTQPPEALTMPKSFATMLAEMRARTPGDLLAFMPQD